MFFYKNRLPKTYRGFEYYVLKVVKDFPIVQINLIQVDGKVVGCNINGYPRGGNV